MESTAQPPAMVSGVDALSLLAEALDPSFEVDAGLLAVLDRSKASVAVGRPMPSSAVWSAYGPKVAALVRAGQPTIGTQEVLERLQRAEEPIVIAAAETPDMWFVIFLDSSLKSAGGFGVRRQAHS